MINTVLECLRTQQTSMHNGSIMQTSVKFTPKSTDILTSCQYRLSYHHGRILRTAK